VNKHRLDYPAVHFSPEASSLEFAWIAVPSASVSQSTSLSLIQQARSQDPEAWRTLSRLYGPLVYSWARQCGLQAHDAADVVQNVFVSIFRSLGKLSLDGPQSSFRGWLWTLTRNAVREFVRKRNARPLPAGGSDAYHALQQSPDLTERDAEPAEFDSRQSLAHRALHLVRESIDECTWEAFRRTVILDQPAVEVAAELQMTAQAVRQAKYRVLCRLRRLLAES
jgi:RNA polymerase sigma-70 factor (ECF subfamily)